MRVKSYLVLARAVEEGAAGASHRIFKHVASRTVDDADEIAEVFVDRILGAICEVFDFDDDDEEEIKPMEEPRCIESPPYSPF